MENTGPSHIIIKISSSNPSPQNIIEIRDSNLDETVNYQQVDSSNKKPYSCNFCGKMFSFLHNLNTHRLTHNKGHKERCPECDKAYKSKIALAYHMKKGNCAEFFTHEIMEKDSGDDLEQMEADVNPSVINVGGTPQSETKKNKKRRLKYKFNCFKCNFKTNYTRGLQRHLLTHNSNYQQSDTKPILYCSECTFTSKDNEHFTMHLLQHSVAKSCSQAYCDSKVEPIDKHTLTNSKNNIKKHSHCSVSTYKEETVGKYKLKQKMVRQNEPLNRTECAYKTDFNNATRNHEYKHLSTKLFKCGECKFESTDKRSFLHHTLTHSNAKIFYCTSCDYQTNRKDCLDKHSLGHSMSNLFQCTKCHFKTKYKHTIKKHVLEGSETSLFTCLECNFRTQFKCEYQKHKKSHSKKLFQCSYCTFSTNNQQSLSKHTSKHFPEKRYKCSICSFETMDSFSLEEHIKRHNAAQISSQEAPITIQSRMVSSTIDDNTDKAKNTLQLKRNGLPVTIIHVIKANMALPSRPGTKI